jgi:hypothetical protein
MAFIVFFMGFNAAAFIAFIAKRFFTASFIAFIAKRFFTASAFAFIAFIAERFAILN